MFKTFDTEATSTVPGLQYTPANITTGYNYVIAKLPVIICSRIEGHAMWLLLFGAWPDVLVGKSQRKKKEKKIIKTVMSLSNTVVEEHQNFRVR